MLDRFTSVRQLLHAFSAAALVVLPTTVAMDRGGVLAWDRWAMAMAAILLVLTSGVGESLWDLRGHGVTLRRGIQLASVQWAPTLLLLAIVALALCQSVPMPTGIVQRLAPASAEAFSQWLPAATGLPAPDSHPITVGADLTSGYAIRMLAIASLAYCATLVFANRDLVPVLLVGLVVMALVHSAAGFYQQQNSPGVALFINERMGGPFGTFVNRNSAGGLLNLGLAGAIGLLIFRVHWVSGIVKEEFEQAAKARAAREKRDRKESERRKKEAKLQPQEKPGAGRVRYYKPPTKTEGQENDPKEISPASSPGTKGSSPGTSSRRSAKSSESDAPSDRSSRRSKSTSAIPPVRKIESLADFPLTSQTHSPPASWIPKQTRPSLSRGKTTALPLGSSGAGQSPSTTNTGAGAVTQPGLQGPRGPAFPEPIDSPSSDFFPADSPLKRTTERLVRDPMAILAAVGILVTIAAIFASGSRGAVVGGLCGFIACLTAAIPINRIFRWVVAGVFVFFIVITSLDQLGIAATALERLEESQTEGIENDGRFSHWPDALHATMNYLPMGAGMGAYRYAYLPFQETSMGSWCINADNQWLELMLEGGLPAALILLASVVAAVVSLVWLVDSKEPVDRGLAVAGVFALTAMVVAESFDFALMMMGPASAAALLAGAISARSIPCRLKSGSKSQKRGSGNREDAEEQQASSISIAGGVQFWGRVCSAARLVGPAFFVILLGIAIPVAREQAASEAVWIAANDLLDQPMLSRQALEEIDAALVERIEAEPQNHRMYSARSLVQSALFRLSEAEESAATSQRRKTVDQELRRFSLPAVRRQAFARLPLQWESQPSENAITGVGSRFEKVGAVWLPTEESAELPRYVPVSGESLGHLRLAAEMARESLMRAPLSDTGRWVLVRADFAVTDARRTPILLKQLGVLRERTVESQMEVVQASIDMGAVEQVKESLGQAVSVNGNVLSRAMEVIAAYEGRIAPSEVIPSDSRGLTLAAIQWQLRRKNQPLDPELKRRALKYLELPISGEERSLKEALLLVDG